MYAASKKECDASTTVAETAQLELNPFILLNDERIVRGACNFGFLLPFPAGSIVDDETSFYPNRSLAYNS
jgi:hypothetical protein